MPLFEMPANVQEPEPASRKRTLDDFVKQNPTEPQGLGSVPAPKRAREGSSDKENFFVSPKKPTSTPALDSPGLTAAGSSPLEANSPSPNPTPDRATANALSPTRSSNPSIPAPSSTTTPTMASAQPPAKKRKRLTEAEKKAKLDAEAAKKLEKEAQQAAKEAQKAAKVAEQAEREKEREKKRREKEEAEKVKAEEKATKQAEKRQKVEEKEQKKREKEEEVAKKDRSQMRLNMFFQKPSTPKKEPAVKLEDQNKTGSTLALNESPAKAKPQTWFEKEFRPFFVKDNVKLAKTAFAMDDETLEAKCAILDKYLSGEREHAYRPFEPVEALQLPFKLPPRGRVSPSVREIIAKYSGSSEKPIDVSAQNAQILDAHKALKAIPLKSLKFREDVRPPYIGTISTLPQGVTSLRKIARNPISRKVLPLNYDYDSEAEWQDDDGEDLDNDEDDDEDMDDDEEMGDFLDDSEDMALIRPQFLGGMEPKCHGPNWENTERFGTEPSLNKYRMEFCLESLQQHHGIDPFETCYWGGASKTSANTTTGNSSSTAPDQPSDVANPAPNTATPMAPPPAPTDAFHALTGGGNVGKKVPQGLPADMLEKLKDLVRQNPKLSKTGVIELFRSQTDCPRNQITVSFDAITEKVSSKIRKVKGDK